MDDKKELKLDLAKITQEHGEIVREKLIEQNIREEKRGTSVTPKGKERIEKRKKDVLRKKALIVASTLLIAFGSGVKTADAIQDYREAKGYEVSVDKEEINELYNKYEENKFRPYEHVKEGGIVYYDYGLIASAIEEDYEFGYALRAFEANPTTGTSREDIDKVCRMKYDMTFREYLDSHGFVEEGKDISNKEDDKIYTDAVKKFKEWTNREAAKKTLQNEDISKAVEEAINSGKELNVKYSNNKGL